MMATRTGARTAKPYQSSDYGNALHARKAAEGGRPGKSTLETHAKTISHAPHPFPSSLLFLSFMLSPSLCPGCDSPYTSFFFSPFPHGIFLITQPSAPALSASCLVLAIHIPGVSSSNPSYSSPSALMHCATNSRSVAASIAADQTRLLL